MKKLISIIIIFLCILVVGCEDNQGKQVQAQSTADNISTDSNISENNNKVQEQNTTDNNESTGSVEQTTGDN